MAGELNHSTVQVDGVVESLSELNVEQKGLESVNKNKLSLAFLNNLKSVGQDVPAVRTTTGCFSGLLEFYLNSVKGSNSTLMASLSEQDVEINSMKGVQNQLQGDLSTITVEASKASKKISIGKEIGIDVGVFVGSLVLGAALGGIGSRLISGAAEGAAEDAASGLKGFFKANAQNIGKGFAYVGTPAAFTGMGIAQSVQTAKDSGRTGAISASLETAQANSSIANSTGQQVSTNQNETAQRIANIESSQNTAAQMTLSAIQEESKVFSIGQGN